MFIAIVERGFSSLKNDPPVDYHESSGEEEESEAGKFKQEKEKSKKKLEEQSINAFKKILNAGKKSNKIEFDENTLNKIQVMDKLVDQILDNMKDLLKKMTVFQKGTNEFVAMKEHLEVLIELQILPILDHFN